MRAKYVVFALLPSVILLTVAELVASFVSPKSSVFWANPMMLQYPVQGFDTSATLEQLNFSTDPNRLVHYVPDSTRWYRLAPEPEIPETGYLIIHLGDSSTWGWGLSDRHFAYPGVLQATLPNSIHSINLGVPGYSSLQGLKYLELILQKYSGRIIVVTLYFGNNDAVENGGSDEAKLELAKQNGALVNVVRWLEQRSAFYRVAEQVARRFHRQTNQRPRITPHEYQRNMQAMIDLCNKSGIKVVVIEPPVNLSWKPGHLNFWRSLEKEVANPWVRQELKQAQQLYTQGVDLVDMRDDAYEGFFREAVEHDWIMSRIKEPWRKALNELIGAQIVHLPTPFIEAEYPGWFVDYCHPSVRVHTLLAYEIAKKLGF